METKDKQIEEPRLFFIRILNKLGLTNHGAEIGVFKGDLSKMFLTHWEGKKLYCIDPWKLYFATHQGRRVPSWPSAPQIKYERNYNMAIKKLSSFVKQGRCEILREFSECASNSFADGILDFVYIDGAHDYDSVLKDCASWWRVVKDGGCLSGHDFYIWEKKGCVLDVIPAVETFFKDKKEHIFIPHTEFYCKNWMVLKGYYEKESPIEGVSLYNPDEPMLDGPRGIKYPPS